MPPLKTYFLSIGSNIDPKKYIKESKTLLKKSFPSAKFSSTYETEPVGTLSGQNKFWNLAAMLQTGLSGRLLSQELRKIEASLGRVRNPENRFAPRTIDLDLLPQPDYQTLGFIMVPLAELSPDTVDPQTKKTFLELSKELRLPKTWGKKLRA